MADKFSIRKACIRDFDQILILCEQLGYHAQEKSLYQRLSFTLDSPDDVVFVAQTTKGNVVGWAHALVVCFLEVERFVEIGGLVVDSEYRRQGVGRALMKSVEVWTESIGIHHIRLRSNSIRKEAHKFYRSIGYENQKSQLVFYKPI